jgi:outer membrane protein W
MLRKLSIAILPGLVFLSSLPARGQSQALFGPQIGMQKAQDADNHNYLIGATLRLRMMPALGIEGGIGYRQEDFGNDALTIREWPVTVTALLYPLPIAYGGVGGGWYNSTFDYNDTYNAAGIDDETESEFGWHLAAGLELPASPRLRIYGDVRYVFLDRKFKELPDAVLEGADSDSYSINVGLLFGL